MKTLYEILGVDKSADRDAIKAAYRKAAQRTHPDREGGSEAEFKKVKHAFEVLHDPERRKQYDETGVSGDGQKETPEADANRIIQSMLERYIEKALCQDPLKFMRGELARVKAEQQQALRQLNKKLEKTRKLMDHLVSKTKSDTVELLIQVTLAKINREVLGSSHIVTACDVAMGILESYDYTGPVEAVQQRDPVQASLADLIKQTMQQERNYRGSNPDSVILDEVDAFAYAMSNQHGKGEKPNKAKGTKYSSPNDPKNFR